MREKIAIIRKYPQFVFSYIASSHLEPRSDLGRSGVGECRRLGLSFSFSLSFFFFFFLSPRTVGYLLLVAVRHVVARHAALR